MSLSLRGRSFRGPMRIWTLGRLPHLPREKILERPQTGGSEGLAVHAARSGACGVQVVGSIPPMIPSSLPTDAAM